MIDLFKIFRKKEQSRDEVIKQMRDEERRDYKIKMTLIRTSKLNEAEKKVQRDVLRKEYNHLLTIYK